MPYSESVFVYVERCVHVASVDYFHWQYISGGSNPKIFAAPPWDFDRAYANNLGVPTTEIYNHEGFAFGFAFEEEEHLRWWPHFLLVPGIAARISSRWKELRLGALSDNKINSQIKSFESQLAPAMLSNFERWPVLGTKSDALPPLHHRYIEDIPVSPLFGTQDYAMRECLWIITLPSVFPKRLGALSYSSRPG